MTMLYSGQGKVLVAPRIDDVVGAYRWVGNVPTLKPAFTSNKLKKNESFTGQRLLLGTLPTGNELRVAAELDEWYPENLALAVRGESIDRVSGTVAAPNADISPDGLVQGSAWALSHQNVSTVVITDSNAPPATLSATTDYSLDPVFGTVVPKNDLATFTLPLKATYSFGAAQIVAFFTQPVSQVSLRFEGLNTADSNRPVLVEFYKIDLDVAKEFGLITNEFGVFSIEGDALVDPTKPDDPVFGKFGRMIYL
jgi:hypothetical protein